LTAAGRSVIYMTRDYPMKTLLTATLVLTMATAVAAAKPNFSGDWKMNAAKSDFGQMPAPDSMSQKIAHTDPKLEMHIKQSSQMGDLERDVKYTTDGKESTNMMRDNPAVSVVKWDGDVLTFETKGKFGDNEFTMKDRWTLSEDGKVLTMQRLFSSSFGEGEQKVVMEKQ
jgi:hypothetical protein